MENILEKAAVKRFIEARNLLGVSGEVHVLSESARTAAEAAASLNIEVGQIASSLIFLPPSAIYLASIASSLFFNSLLLSFLKKLKII